MPAILALETSSPVLSVALKSPKGKVFSHSLSGLLNHSENLLPIMDKLLKKAKISIGDVEIFLIDRGPGSFTGLRAGFASLKGFLAVEEKECYGAISLDLIAENANLPEKSKLAVCLDARREKIYFRLYERKNRKWHPLTELDVMTVQEVLSKLPREVFITGDALARYKNTFQEKQGKKKFHFLAEKTWYPLAEALIDFHENRRSALKRLKGPNLLPLYFRLSEAEEKRQENKKQHANSC